MVKIFFKVNYEYNCYLHYAINLKDRIKTEFLRSNDVCEIFDYIKLIKAKHPVYFRFEFVASV